MEVFPVVLDIGTLVSKCGFANDLLPRALFPTIVGHSKNKTPAFMKGMGVKDCYVGDEALSKCGFMVIEYPIHRGLVADWEYMEKLWHHSFYNEIRCAPEEHPVLLLEPPNNTKDTREKTTQIMFETFSVPALCFTNPAVSSVRAAGVSSGVVLCSGGATSFAMAVHNQMGLPKSLVMLDLGGDDLTDQMARLLNEQYPDGFTTSSERRIVGRIRETLGYVALDCANESQKNDISKTYELPDGQTIINIAHERYKCHEALFEPSLCGVESDGIHALINTSIKKCPTEIHSLLYNNIVLSGGNTLISGLDKRLLKELGLIAPEHEHEFKIANLSYELRHYAPFIGACKLAETDNFLQFCILKADYDEVGSSIVHSKCPLGVL